MEFKHELEKISKEIKNLNFDKNLFSQIELQVKNFQSFLKSNNIQVNINFNDLLSDAYVSFIKNNEGFSKLTCAIECLTEQLTKDNSDLSRVIQNKYVFILKCISQKLDSITYEYNISCFDDIECFFTNVSKYVDNLIYNLND